MIKTTTSPILQLIRRTVEDQRANHATDQELLCRFRSERDEAAFHTLLCRHGSMVLDVCRNVLGNEADAEDAFQATFLLLARKAGAIRRQASVGSWLHGVAYRVALKARKAVIRRQQREKQAAAERSEATGASAVCTELQAELDEALQWLPEKYRAALLCCYFEGRS